MKPADTPSLTAGAIQREWRTPTGIKDWTHARVFVEGDVFCRVSGGTFFTREGATKAHCLAIGAPTEAYQGSMDDYC